MRVLIETKNKGMMGARHLCRVKKNLKRSSMNKLEPESSKVRSPAGATLLRIENHTSAINTVGSMTIREH